MNLPTHMRGKYFILVELPLVGLVRPLFRETTGNISLVPTTRTISLNLSNDHRVVSSKNPGNGSWAMAFPNLELNDLPFDF